MFKASATYLAQKAQEYPYVIIVIYFIERLNLNSQLCSEDRINVRNHLLLSVSSPEATL